MVEGGGRRREAAPGVHPEAEDRKKYLVVMD